VPDRAARARAAGDTLEGVAGVILNFRDASGARTAAERFLATHGGVPLLIVDNGSGDGSAEVLAGMAARDPRVRVIAEAVNRGYSGGMNRAAGEAARLGAEFVLLLNPDASLDAGGLPRLVQAFEDPAVAAAAPRIIENERPWQLQSVGGGLDPVRQRAWLALHGYPDVFATVLAGRAARPVPWLSGCCLMVRTSLFATSGPFDEAFFLYAEDIDLGLRLNRSGWRCVVVPAARARHRTTARGTPPAPIRYCQVRNWAWLWRRHAPAAGTAFAERYRREIDAEARRHSRAGATELAAQVRRGLADGLATLPEPPALPRGPLSAR
jgi:GT2 family glycosyltransferase